MIWNEDAETLPVAGRRQLQLERLQALLTWVRDRVPLSERLRIAIGLGVEVTLVPPGTLPRSEGKAVRVIEIPANPAARNADPG